MPYTITRSNPARDLEALKAILDNDGIVEGDVEVLEQIADAIKQQLPKPSVDEPEAFGSVIRATTHSLRCKWQRSPLNGTRYWQSEFGEVEVWSELTDVEVLRVGLGDLDKEREEIWTQAERELAGEIHMRLRALLADSIGAERKNAYEKAIQAVEEVTP